MSRATYANLSQRWGARMGDAKSIDMMVGALTDPFDTVHMGITAENVATKCGITRAQQDAFAVESHRRAAAAIGEGRFKSQILPIELKSKKGPIQFDTDEHVRGDASAEGMAKLKAVFAKENGTVTAGNASGINDAAAAVVLMEAQAAQRADVKPMARLVAYGHAGIDPKIMGLGPVSAVKSALKKAGLRIGDIDVIESNEAFAAQALGVNQQLDLDPAKVNPNGGAVALGHPIGATGCILTIKAMYELHRTNKRYASSGNASGRGRRSRTTEPPRPCATFRSSPSRSPYARTGCGWGGWSGGCAGASIAMSASSPSVRPSAHCGCCSSRSSRCGARCPGSASAVRAGSSPCPRSRAKASPTPRCGGLPRAARSSACCCRSAAGDAWAATGGWTSAMTTRR
jgi:hypothetical protein